MSNAPYMPLWVGDFLLKTGDLDARETGAYLLLLMAMWSRDGSLPADQKKLQRVAKCGREWPSVWAAIKHYFTEENGQITNKRLTEELQKVCAKREYARAWIPRHVQRDVHSEGECRYCGATSGPFEIDHVFPVSRGGSDHRDNLALACKPCNRSKRDKTVEEWMN